MFTLFFILSLVLTLVLVFLTFQFKFEFYVGTVLSGLLTFVLLISVAYQCYQVFCRANTISDQIKMYEEENRKIEEKIDITVQNYIEHENKTYTNIKPENVMTALIMFPELNSYDLVKKEIEIYQSNQDKLLELKEEQINDIPTARFLLYFGS